MEIQFVPFTSVISAPFWHRFSELKLNTLLLNEDSISISAEMFRFCLGSTGSSDGQHKDVFVSGLNITEESLSSRSLVSGSPQQTIIGDFLNKNTAEGFRKMDKTEHINKLGEQIWSQLISDEGRIDPEKLLKFNLVSFADLKKFHFFHWMAFPAPLYPESSKLCSTVNISDLLPPDKINRMALQLQGLKSPLFFAVSDWDDSPVVHKFKDIAELMQQDKTIVFGFVDFSCIEGAPSWPARILLALIAYHFPILCTNLKLLCWRQFGGENRSLLLKLNLSSEKPDSCPRFVGWEKNTRGKFGPNMTNLGATMDPLRLAESAVSLNLKLMKWRLMPNIDLELLESTKCLILGAGTLGCGVARSLQAWGFKRITLVDSGKVSYSNPVRQSLYKFEDCKHGKMKSIAAAQTLKEIFPGTEADGVVLEIPMPGHAVSFIAEADVKTTVTCLEALYDDHDVIFLLLDSREARWLPTLLGAAKGKVIINAALGFDSYLVMRHGLKKITAANFDRSFPVPENNSAQLSGAIPGGRLGCYFCNDVVAPGDSLHDRTLDQQCTVTRPGVAMIASALAVELLVSGLQHPEKFNAPAAISSDTDVSEGPLGVVPHSIRGYISRHNLLLPATEAFSKCTACSDIVVEAYRRDGFVFLKKAFNDPIFLEALTGLDKLKDLTGFEEVLEFSDSEASE